MSNIVRIPEGVAILVCDAKKALILSNAGAVAQPELHVEESFESDLAGALAGNSAPPGRRFDGGAAAVAGGSRSAMEAPDPEAKRAELFAERIVAALARRHRRTPIKGVLLVAPPSFLGVLRQKMSADLRKLIQGEVAKELTDMPVSEIQKVLLKSL